VSLAALVSEARSWAWICFLLAFALAVGLRFLLPPARRRRLRGSFLLLGLFLALSFIAWPLPPQGGHVVHLFAAFFLTLAGLHVVSVLIFDGLARGRVPAIVQDLVLAVAFFVVVMGLFRASGVALSSILTTSALLTAVLAFALQDVLGNILGGLALQLKGPYAVGDWVSLDGRPEQYGAVLEINWRATRLLTNEQVLVVVPNSTIAKGTILNFSQPSKVVRRAVAVSVAYEIPPSRVEEVALHAMRSSPGVLSDPPPECVLVRFGDSGIDYSCRFFIDDFRRRDAIGSAVASRLYYDFLRSGLTIPYPIRTVHMHARTDEQEKRERERRLARLAERFQAIDFLAPLGPEVLEELAARVETVVYGRGESIVREGEQGSDLYVVDRGEVSVRVDGGASEVVARLRAGDFFGEMSLMTGEPRRADVVALGDVEAVRVDKASFREVLSRNPKVVEEISRVLAQRTIALEAHATASPKGEGGVEGRSRALVNVIRSFFRL
jgi:small-conductance mechanosensitive channel/CRP-like cAMP-binding protein